MTYKEILRYVNEAYYDLDYGRSDNAKLKDDTRKYLNQSMYWLEELRSKLKKEIDNEKDPATSNSRGNDS
jgi:hypothetical protein